MKLFRRAPTPDPAWLARLEVVEKRLKALDVEWDEWYDKYRRLYARLAKRVAHDEKAAEDAPGSTNGKAPFPPLNPLAARLLRPLGEVGKDS